MILSTKNINVNASKNNLIVNFFGKNYLKTKSISKNICKTKHFYNQLNLKITTKKCIVHINTNVVDVYAVHYKEELPAELYSSEVNWQYTHNTLSTYGYFNIPYTISTIRDNHTNRLLYPNHTPNPIEFLKNHLYDIENENQPLWVYNKNKFKNTLVSINVNQNYTINFTSEYVHAFNYIGDELVSYSSNNGNDFPASTMWKVKTNAVFFIRSLEINTLKLKMKGQAAFQNVKINNSIYYDLPSESEPIMPWTTSGKDRVIPYVNSTPMNIIEFSEPYLGSNKLKIIRVVIPYYDEAGNFVSQGFAYIPEWGNFNPIGDLKPAHCYRVRLN